MAVRPEVGPFKGMHSIYRRKRTFTWMPENPAWRCVLDPKGVPVILDANGRRPLHDVDGVERLRNRHLAACAPQLREALILALQRLEIQRGSDDELFIHGLSTLYDTQPLESDVQRVSQEPGQGELDFEDDHAA